MSNSNGSKDHATTCLDEIMIIIMHTVTEVSDR